MPTVRRSESIRIPLSDLVDAARDLRSDVAADNPEYDRALVELVAYVTTGNDDGARALVELAILGDQQ